MTSEEQKRAKFNLWCIGIMALIILLIVIATCNSSSGKEEKIEPAKEVVYNNDWDNSVEQVEEYLKRSLNDPDSYKAVEWSNVLKNPDTGWFIVRHKYRAKNAFGGIITKEQVFTLDSLGIVISVSDVD